MLFKSSFRSRLSFRGGFDEGCLELEFVYLGFVGCAVYRKGDCIIRSSLVLLSTSAVTYNDRSFLLYNFTISSPPHKPLVAHRSSTNESSLRFWLPDISHWYSKFSPQKLCGICCISQNLDTENALLVSGYASKESAYSRSC